MTGNTPRHESGTVSVGRFEFERGGAVPELELAYEQYGTYDPDGGPEGEGNAVLVCHALTGSQHVASAPAGEESTGAAGQASAWWDEIVGPGAAIDTTEYTVVCVNVPGSCYGSTGPASEHPDGGRWGSAFPPVTVPDWTRAQRRLLRELGIDSLHAVVGGSVGGMNTLDWARQFPDEVARVAPVATAPRLDAQLLAINGVARRAIRSDPDWRGGDYYGETHPDHGLMLARQLGHVTYLSKSSMDGRFGRDPTEHTTEEPFPETPGSDAFPYRSVESYLDHQASSFVERFDANSYLWLTRAMDEFDLAAGVEDDATALSGFDGDALVLSFTGDWHFTVDDAAGVARAFDDAGAAVAHHVVDSDYGHDAFLVEDDVVGPPLRDFLEAGVDGDAVEHVDCSEVEALDDDPCGDGAPGHPTARSD